MDRDHVQQLIKRLKNGDSAVLETIYTKYRKPFLSFASRYNLDKEELLDIYQDSILALVDNVRNGKIETLDSTLKTYLFSIGKFMIFKKLKHLEVVNELPLDTNRLEHYANEIDNQRVYEQEELELFKKCFGQLGKQCQELLNLFYYRGYTLEEIQETLDYDNYNVVKSQKSRCLKHLKELIKSKKQNAF